MAAKAYDTTTVFGDRVHVVHLYVIEPHPQAPDVSPYSGVVGEARYSTIRQPRSYAEREAAARVTAGLLSGPQLLLIDDLGNAAINPIWCTYGTCPNCAFLIRRDGTIDTGQTWLDTAAMESAIRKLLTAR